MTRSKLLGGLLLLVLPLFLWLGVASAQTFRGGNDSTVAAGEVVDSSLYMAGNSVDIAGEVHGDVFCAGQNITISGKVTGDVICAGQTVTISGVVEGDARVAGQTVSIGGEVRHNVSAAAQTFSLDGKASIGGDLSVGGNTVNLHGKIGRDAALGGATTTISGTVSRNVKASTEKLTLNNQASIGGELTYTSNNEASVSNGAKVVGATRRYEPPKETKPKFAIVPGFAIALYIVLSMLVIALAVVLLFPGALVETTNKALEAPWKTLLVGLVTGLVVPVLVIALVVTVIGIPLALLLLGIWLVLLGLAGPFSSYFLGRKIIRGGHPVVIMLAGSLVVLVLYLIPILNILVWLAVAWLGTGMLLREVMRRTPKPAYEHHRAHTSTKKK
jgi:cytoskeletal protein CcmA (bactofilin family)